MEFTCLGLGKDQGDWDGPSCHLLQASGIHILLDCPLDMSMLGIFCPASVKRQMPVNMHDQRKLQKRGLFNDVSPSVPLDGGCSNIMSGIDAARGSATALSNSSGPVRVPSNVSNSWTSAPPPLREVNGQLFLDVEPWYKTAEFGLVDLSSIDAVLISNPEGMLGLPLLTRMEGFSAKIYATSVTAKLGQLLMEELAYVHAEYVRHFGRSESEKTPFWLEPETVETFSSNMKKALVDDDGVGRPNWYKLYRKKDIESCMQKDSDNCHTSRLLS